MARTPAVVTLLLAAVLVAGCTQSSASYREPPAIVPQPSGAFAGAADGDRPGCDASLDGTSGFTLCGVRFTQQDGRFTIAGFDPGARPMRWSDLRLRAANANLAVQGDDPADARLIQGDTDLGPLHGGRVAEGQSIVACRTFQATGPATLMLWDARPIGGAVQQTYVLLPCEDLPAEVLAEDTVVEYTPVTVSFSMDLNVGQAYAGPSSTATNNANCVRVPDHMAPWSGNVTATWTPTLPTQAELVFGADGGQAVGVMARSGHTLEIPPQPGTSSTGGGFIGLSPPDPGAALSQPIRLDLVLTVMSDGSGDPADAINTGTCRVMLA